MGDTLALGGEEGRDKSLRKAAGRGKCPVIADVRMGQPAGAITASRRAGGEQWELKHLSTARGEKVTTIPPVAASERGGPNRRCRKACAGVMR